ncbi:MAG: DEAD/DEAH box helicase [Actinobacteria bacterium]|nr:DEAD/DEAH box helicase [Actinomycetota bacterium]
MLVVHALWSSKRSLGLWAETTEDPLTASGDAKVAKRGATTPSLSGSRPRGDCGESAQPQPHPFAAPAADLLYAIGKVSTGEASKDNWVFALPSLPSSPVPSPVAMRFRHRSRSRARLRLVPWTVPVVVPKARDAARLIQHISSTRLEGVLTGPSVQCLAAAGCLAVDLVARGRVLPALVEEDGGVFLARWLAVPGPQEHRQIRELAQALPPMCRSELDPSDDGPFKGQDPGVVVQGFVCAVADSLVRSAVAGHEPLPPRAGLASRRIPVPEAFLLALVEPEASKAVVQAKDGLQARELKELSDALLAWHRSGQPQVGAARTCFRLIPPSQEEESSFQTAHQATDLDVVGSDRAEESWRLEVLLQSVDDPSLMVAAPAVWDGSPAASAFESSGVDSRQCLLRDLGRASRIYPELEPALDTARPEALELDVAGAHHFLSHAAPLLSQAGFGVLVPPWWRSRPSRLGVRVRARPAHLDGSGFGLGLDALCEFSMEVAIGNHTVSLEELRRLARLKVPLVRVRGQWVELRPEDISAALALISEPSSASQTAGDLLGDQVGFMSASGVLRAALGLDGIAGGLPVVDVQGEGWLAFLLGADADRRLEPMPTPSGFGGKLRPYQERGLGWLSFLDRLGLGGCLADDMGLGKTAQLLSLLVAERDVCRDEGDIPHPGPGDGLRLLGPTLLICPMSVVGNWQRETERFAPGLRVQVHHGSERERGEGFVEVAQKADIVITTYALVTRDEELLSKVAWHRVVLDEAQNVKNAQSKQAIAVRSLGSSRRVALTGTPVENRLSELWSIMEFLNPGMLGSERAFRERFALPIERGHDGEAAGLLKRLTGPFLLRRLKTDRSIISDLPAKVEMKVLCNLTREQATLYQAVVDDMMARIEESDGMERRGLVLVTMVKLKQVCNHPAQLLKDGSHLSDRSGKLSRLEEVLEEVVAEGDRALCFTQFAEMGQLLKAHLEPILGVEVPFLYGKVSKTARDQMVEQFGSKGGPPVMLVSLKAGGTGLNLTAANHVIHFDRWWNPAVEDQATDRAFRIGQLRNVQVRKFVCVGTLEERIDAMIEEKRALSEAIVGSGEAWLTELSTEQLRELVALSADAVAE